MQRVTWTDERLDDLSHRMDAGFEMVDRDIRELRHEVRAVRTDLSGQISELRTHADSEIRGVRTDLGAEIDKLRVAMLQIGIGLIVALIVAAVAG